LGSSADTRRDPCYTGNDALINHQLGWQLVINLYPGTPYDYSATARGHVFPPGACPLAPEGRVVAPGDHELQAVRAVEDLLAALAAHAIGPESLVKKAVFVVAQVRADLVRVWDVVLARLGRAPSILLGVSVLGYPDQLVEIEAIAVLEADT
jgi:enamine deaminase RidA (YjgF/YER057c/UK114 family)